MKNAYLIESISPLVFRSGKPFNATASAQDSTFPLPSTAAGLIRALTIEQGSGQYSDYVNTDKEAKYQQLLNIEAQGPFLIRFAQDAPDNYTVLIPKPANALYFENKDPLKKTLVRLIPKPFDDALCGSDLPQGLVPVQMKTPLIGKPAGGVDYWSLAHVLAWQQGQDLTFDEVERDGLASLPIEIRTHVALDDDTFASKEGQLFQTANVDLAHSKQQNGSWSETRLGFLVLSPKQLTKDMATFGGERRLSYFKPVFLKHSLQKPPLELTKEINKSKGFCVTFLTPAVFEQGYLPAWIDKITLEGTLPKTRINVRLKAVAVERWLAVSGWDSVTWKPKAMRKAVNTGSVYWFELLDDGEMEEKTIQKLWASSIADHEQDRRDGFGMITLSAWQQ